MVAGQGLSLIAIGIVLGRMAALAANRFLAGMLFGLEATDPSTLAFLSLVLAGVGVLAGLVPAFRATRIDPAIALRSE